MGDTTVKKIDSHYSPKGDLGQLHLASGKHLSMRLWEKLSPHEQDTPTKRDYECVGYVIEGSAKLHIEGQVVDLNPGDSWVVPRGATHHYEIIKPFTAVEATCPPSHVHGRDNPH